MPRRLLVLALAAAALAAPSAAPAATIKVTTTADELNADGDCSLREAVQAANSDAAVDGCNPGSGADTVALPAGRYELTGAAGEDANVQGDLDVGESLAIEGEGSAGDCPAPGSTCIDAGGLDRAIDLRDGTAPVALTLHDLTLFDGAVPGGSGGAISSQEADAALTLAGVSVISSAAATGAGIASAGALEVRDSFLARNEATGAGGAISQSGGPLSLPGAVIQDNEAAGGGGGVDASGSASLSADLATFAGNSSVSGDGGAIRFAGTGTMALSQSTVEYNDAREGGGLHSTAPAAISASTFDQNRALGTCAGGAGDGGAIFLGSASFAPLTIANSTISGNAAGCRGGGLRLYANAAPTSIVHSTFSGDAAATGGGAIDNEAGFGGTSSVGFRGSVVAAGSPANCGGDGPRGSAGYNIDSGGTCGLSPLAADLQGVDPQLAPLRFNGGPTRTQLPFSASPAFNLVKGGCPPPATDQRGVPRPVATTCDAGAVEVSPAPLCVSHPATITGTPGNDIIRGTPGPDIIAGLGGDDSILGMGGNDLVCAGAGNDWVLGGAGNDRIRGEAGNDRLLGNGGRDRLEGGPGNDILKGGRGKDKLNGGPGKNKKKQ